MAERSVGLIVMTEIPERGLVAVLRERGRFNFEEMKREKFPGGYQVTAHGKLKRGESLPQALLREVGEELGPRIRRWLKANLERGRTGKPFLTEVYNGRVSEDKDVVTYAASMPAERLHDILLESSSGGLLLLRRQEVKRIADLTSFGEVSGVPNRKIIAMFTYHKEAVVKAFAHFV